MSNLTIPQLAQIAIKHFTQSTRSDGSTFIHLDDDRPEWLYDVVMEAHGNSLPDDQIYDAICRVFHNLADMDESDDPQDVVNEMEPEVYTADLIRWLASDVSYVDYMTQAIEDYEAKDGFAALSIAQKIWIEEIGGNVIRALEAVEVEDPTPKTPEELTEAIRDAVYHDFELDRTLRNWYEWTHDGTEQGTHPMSGETDSDWPALPYKHYDL